MTLLAPDVRAPKLLVPRRPMCWGVIMSSMRDVAAHRMQILLCFTVAQAAAGIAAGLSDLCIALRRGSVHQIDASTHERDRAYESGPQRLVQDRDAGSHAEQRREERKYR